MIPMAAGVIGEGDVLGDLHALVAGEAGRQSDDEITIFKNGGGAHLDIMTAQAIAGAYRLWERDGSGTGDASILEREFDVSLTRFQDYAANLAAIWKSEQLV